MSKRVLLVSDETQRYYWSGFVQRSTKFGTSVFLFDTSQFPRDGTFSISMREDGYISGFVSVKNLGSGLTESIDINSIDLAWYLRPGNFSISEQFSRFERDFAIEESKHSVISLLEALPCRWVNDRRAIRRADDSKFFQQMIAASAGLIVPSTTMGNYPNGILEKTRKYGQSLVKSMGITPLHDMPNKNIYSNIFSISEIEESAKSIENCPVYCQEYISKRYEYRVIFAGGKILACRIDSQASERTRIDWRKYDFDKVAHDQVDLPSDLCLRIEKFMKKMALNFGAIDLIEMSDGQFVFLEVNASGQWGWISQLAGLPVEDAVADMIQDMLEAVQ